MEYAVKIRVIQLEREEPGHANLLWTAPFLPSSSQIKGPSQSSFVRAKRHLDVE